MPPSAAEEATLILNMITSHPILMPVQDSKIGHELFGKMETKENLIKTPVLNLKLWDAG
jgi:hypothetical protein